MATRQTPLRSASQQDIESNVEYGEAVFALLKRKAENQLELIAPAHSEQVVEFWRALLAMQTVQAKLDQERHRLSVMQAECGLTRLTDCHADHAMFIDL